MQGIEHILLALTARERLEAVTRLNSGRPVEQGFALLAVVLLVILVVLLIWVSYTRRAQRKTHTREIFTENAIRRGLGTRDRQILLAIVMRSGLRRTQDVFTAVDAFDRGAIKLLVECTRSRTSEENEHLRSEIGRLREKLGFQIASPAGGMVGLGQASSRDIPAGKSVELTRRSVGEVAVVHGEVLRNDEIEFAVRLATPIPTRTGEPWRVRYYNGLSAWEFDTSTVRCDGPRLVLNHVDSVRFTNRRRFPRIPVHGHALVAYLPFRQGHSTRVDVTAGKVEKVSWSAEEQPVNEVPVFADGRVTELAGPGLRIETSIQVHPGDRVLVMFTLDHSAGESPGGWGTIAAIGRVKHCLPLDSGVSIAVELTGLSDTEVDELAYITAELSSREDDSDGPGRTQARDRSEPVASVDRELG